MRSNKRYKVIEEGKEKEVWDGRYAAVCGIVFGYKDDQEYILANKRGPGCPNEIGKWNMPCGYLDAGGGEINTSREVKEETGITIEPRKFNFIGISDTEEERNVTLRYLARIDDLPDPSPISELRGGEKDEVSEIKWIPLNEIEDYDWAFNQLSVIRYAIDLLEFFT